MADLTDKERSSTTRIVGSDELRAADVTLDNGINKLQVKSTVSVGVGLGRDPLPDNYFTLTAAGEIGDTVRIQIAATTNDSTSPDRDLPAVDYTYTLVASDVGDEQELARNIVDGLKADVDFQNALLDAVFVNGTRAIVHLSSTAFSLQGEFAERPNANDVMVSTTGTTTALLAFDNLIAREKETTLARDPNNPHRSGILGISGTVTTNAGDVNKLIEDFALDGASKDLNVNGGVTPVEFTIDANAAGEPDKVLNEFTLYGTDTNIKVGESNFLGINSALSNGLLIEITKDGVTNTFREIFSTSDFLSRISSGPSNNKIINQSGGDYIQSTFSLSGQGLQLVLENGTTDQIKLTVRDDLTSIDSLFFKADGFERDE